MTSKERAIAVAKKWPGSFYTFQWEQDGQEGYVQAMGGILREGLCDYSVHIHTEGKEGFTVDNTPPKLQEDK